MSSTGFTVWLTGLHGAGKSTIAVQLKQALDATGQRTRVLDEDRLADTVNFGLGTSKEDTFEAVRRTAHVAAMFAETGMISLVTLVSPYETGRTAARQIHKSAAVPFLEIFVDAPIEECRLRDPKGLYEKVDAGTISGVAGCDDPFEEPINADLTLDTSTMSVEECVEAAMHAMAVPMGEVLRQH